MLTRPDHAQGERDHVWPEVLPGGRAVLFTITAQTGGLDTAQIAVRDLRTGTHNVVLRGGSETPRADTLMALSIGARLGAYEILSASGPAGWRSVIARESRRAYERKRANVTMSLGLFP